MDTYQPLFFCVYLLDLLLIQYTLTHLVVKIQVVNVIFMQNQFDQFSCAVHVHSLELHRLIKVHNIN